MDLSLWCDVVCYAKDGGILVGGDAIIFSSVGIETILQTPENVTYP